MRMLIQYPNGLSVEAVLLAANRVRMRVAIAGQRDTVELQKQDACWSTETGAAIEIAALIPLDGIDCSDFCEAMCLRTHTAGQTTGAV